MYGIKDYTAPVDNMRITSGEGPRKSGRTLNGARMSSFHHGVDIASSKPGSKPDIKNITSGKVVWTGRAGGWGNAVIVENPDGYRVQYGHLDSIAVKVGDQVPAGGKIGVMGATGNVTGVHLDLIVTKNGQSIKRDGSVLAPAPASIAKRAGGKIPANAGTPASTNTNTSTANSSVVQSVSPTAFTESSYTPTSTPTSTVQATMTNADIFGGTNNQQNGGTLNLLSGAVGLAVPDTPTENNLFGAVSGMNLGSDLEKIYAEAARAIAGAKDSIDSQPMLQSNNPLRAELGSIFDRIDV